ncbi:MAG: TonB-dependent receptor plug domain-containing protein [Flavobacteriaceae bacterium]|nr:TonB-dependent receptor plug domain-containing protein [Flavobacteriaceae bacterium]
MREAVAVEKEQGRVAFEAVVRRRVDPALLEKGTGNNYKARIYPIPARGYKRVVLAYDEALNVVNNKQQIKVPLSFQKKLEEFCLSIVINGQNESPRIISRSKIKSKFLKESRNYVLRFSEKQFRPSQEFIAEVPLKESISVTSFEDYTYAYRPISNQKIERKIPSKINLLWDVSYSMEARDLKKEFAFLDAYFKNTETLEAQVITFSNSIIDTKNFHIKKGDWSSIRKLLEYSIYDGATSYTSLFKYKGSFDELLVFTDGMNTLSDFPTEIKQPIFVVNSIKKANHSANRNFGENSNGGYINLMNTSIADAVAKLKYLPLRYLGINTSSTKIDSYPEAGTAVFNDFAFAAKGLKVGQEVELLFGYGDVVTLKEKFKVPAPTGDVQIAKIWAQQKISALDKKGDTNKEPIIALAKEFNLVTNFTSLIVLETLADYERFAITPPKNLVENKDIEQNDRSRIGAITTNTDKNLDKELTEAIVEVAETQTETKSLTNGQEAEVTGTVTDSFGEPLPGVNVIVDGIPGGTQTDLYGNYSLTATIGSNIIYSYVGFASLESTVRGNGAINIAMQDTTESLSEVFITGYNGATRKRNAAGFAITTIDGEDLRNKPEADAIRSLNGKIAGVQITGASGATGSGTNFIIRSKSSINGNNQPLFIVDGIPFSSGTNAQGGLGAGGSVMSSRFLDLDPNMIESIQVLKGLSAAVLYGQEGRNGVVTITTKNDPSTGRSVYSGISQLELEREEQAKKRRVLMKEKTLREMGFTTPYLEELQAAIGEEDMYMLYLGQRETYRNHSSYFIDVYDFFKNANAQFADRILSNVVEIEADNYELLRVYAYKMEELGDFKAAAFIYRQVLKLRSEDAQSYRDLALALNELGEYQEALSLLSKILDEGFYEGSHRRDFNQIKPIVLNEIRNILQTKNVKGDVEYLPQGSEEKVTMDMRIVIDWNHNDTDIDLHIVDPDLEECFYGNNKTKMGGQLSEDMTQGFGPEEFSLENASLGSYYVKIDYFGDRYQKVENPTFMKMSIYENYGTKKQQRRIKVMRLSKETDNKLIERIALL